MAQEFDFDIGSVVGPPGATGNGIKSIALLSTSGLSKTYRITMTDDTTFDFVVTDGNGISGASFDAQTNELTLTFQNGTTFTTPSLKGTKGDTGNGISRIEKTGTAGLVDTYTVTYTDGQTFSYTVTNGADGVSPEVTVTPISGGHTVEIEDADGVKTFDVLDGEVTEARLAEALADKAPVILETASGAIASFSDGADSMPVKKLVAQIEPVQDLHGYDHPWPAGGGKNKLQITARTGTNNGVDYTVNKDNDGNIISVVANGTPGGTNNSVFLLGTIPAGTYILSGSTGGSASKYYLLTSGGEAYSYGGDSSPFTISAEKEVYIRVINGFTASNVVFQPMIRLATEADATFAPYSNICPISGHTGAEIEQTGKNLIDWKVSSTTKAVYLKPRTYVLSWNGAFSQSGLWYMRAKDSSGNYYDSKSALGLDSSWTHSNSSHWNYSNTNQPIVFTVPSGCSAVEFFRQNTDGTIPAQLEFGSAASDYEEHRGNQISVTFPSEAGTVYGGTLTLNPDRTGTLVVDRAMLTANGTESWIASSTLISRCCNLVIPDMKLGSFLYCNLYEFVSTLPLVADRYGKIMTFYNSGLNYNVIGVGYNDGETVDLAGFKAFLSENPLQVVYELATPITYQLAAEQVGGILTTLYGTNNIWANTGDVEVTYPADTKLYIDGKLAEIQATILENIGG